MTAKGHLFFSIAFVVFAKKMEFTSVLVQSDWWHIIPSSILTCLLPDIDHPKSFLGQRCKWISKMIARILGHRGFTHSLFCIFLILVLFFFFIKSDSFFIYSDVAQGMILGYLSHIFADMLTPYGVPLLWPFRWRFCIPILILKGNYRLERILCMIFFIFSICMPEFFFKKDVFTFLYKKFVNQNAALLFKNKTK